MIRSGFFSIYICVAFIVKNYMMNKWPTFTKVMLPDGFLYNAYYQAGTDRGEIMSNQVNEVDLLKVKQE